MDYWYEELDEDAKRIFTEDELAMWQWLLNQLLQQHPGYYVAISNSMLHKIVGWAARWGDTNGPAAYKDLVR